MLENRNTTLNRAISNKTNCMKEYLEIIVQGFTSKIYMEFSDKEMKLRLSGQYSEKTVRNITKKLLDDEIIDLSKIGNKGEKFYKIIDKKKAVLLYN